MEKSARHASAHIQTTIKGRFADLFPVGISRDGLLPSTQPWIFAAGFRLLLKYMYLYCTSQSP